MKRPDQYNIDPSEGGATDYKNLPQTGRGNAGDLDTTELDRQKLAQDRKKAEGQPLPPDVPAPSAHVKHGTKAAGTGTPEKRDEQPQTPENEG